MNTLSDLTTAEVKDLAERMGVPVAKLRAIFAARDLAERALRIRRPMELLSKAAENLPRFARDVLRDGDSVGTVATGLGLVGDDEPLSAAREVIEQLSMADQVPKPQPAGARSNRVPPNARAVRPLTGFGEAIYGILCEHGQQNYEGIKHWLRETKFAESLRGVRASLDSLIRVGVVREVDGRGGPFYEIVLSAEVERG